VDIWGENNKDLTLAWVVSMIRPIMVTVSGFSIAEFQFKRIKENELSFHINV